LSDGFFIALGLVAVLVCFGVHWLLYLRMAPALRAPDLEARRAGIVRWFWLLAGWELFVLVLAAGYILVARGAYPSPGAWLAPAVGAIAGNALPLQFAALAISRAAR
jgi:hypothetical protein